METNVNNNCKAFTSIGQSKKLAGILSLKSADMHYFDYGDCAKLYVGFDVNETKPEINKGVYEYIPCWSLASLIEEIPETIDFEDDDNNYTLEILKETGLYYISYGNQVMGEILNIEPQENFIDACVAMIEKLNERKKL